VLGCCCSRSQSQSLQMRYGLQQLLFPGFLFKAAQSPPRPATVAAPTLRRRGAHGLEADPEDPELTSRAQALLLNLPGCEALAKSVTARWNPRLVSTAGQAFPARWAVVLNPMLRALPGEVERTLRHELAHLVAHWRAGIATGGHHHHRSRRRGKIAAHGPEWRRACVELGIAGEERCHQLPLPRRAVARRHVYQCPRCGMILRRVRPIPPRRPLACRDCCRQHAGGRFDRRFVFVEMMV